MYLVDALTGQAFPGRCSSPNLCDHCAKLQAIENTEMLTLDALHGVAPNLYGLLTTRTATLDMAGFYRAHQKITERLREEFGQAVEIARLLEFTTGRGIRAGGLRRPHWNLTTKGIEDGALDDARAVLRETWCRYVDALPEHQDLQPIRSAGGLMRYIAMHFQKESQKPPAGFSGHRLTKTRGYLWLPTGEARKAARESLRRKRIAWKIEQANPDLFPDELHHYAEERAAIDAARTFSLVRTLPGNPPRARPARARSFD